MRFLCRYPSGWHSFAPDMRRVVNGLADRGLIQVNQYKQMRLRIGKRQDETDRVRS
jgi:hypothetical protein